MKPRLERHAASMRARYGNRAQREPRNPKEWREAVLAACALRAIEDCRLYGLLKAGPVVNVARCDDLIDKGRARGIVPSREEINAAAVAIIQELNR